MSPRIIHIPLSGGDRKAQAKGIRYAHGIHNSYFKESVLIRSAAEAKIREADRLECETWNAIMWAGGPAMPSPGEPQGSALRTQVRHRAESDANKRLMHRSKLHHYSITSSERASDRCLRWTVNKA